MPLRRDALATLSEIVLVMEAIARKHGPNAVGTIGEAVIANPSRNVIPGEIAFTMTARAIEFFKTYDLLLTPTTIVPPFPIEHRYVAECAGKKFENYVEWLGIVYAITLACCPSLSLPCGFTASGLPVGVQVVGAPRADAQVLAGAKVLEDILGLRGTTPIDPKVKA